MIYFNYIRLNMSYLFGIKENKFDFSEYVCNIGCIILIFFLLQSSLKYLVESDFVRQLVVLFVGQVIVKFIVRFYLIFRLQVKG